MINSKINLNRTNKLVFLALFLICIVFLIFGVKEVYRIDYLYSYDPLHHMNIAKNVDSKEPMALAIETYGGGIIGTNYPTTLRLLTVIINKVTGLSYLNVYKLFGLFCRILTILAIYIAVKYLVKNKVAAVLASVLFLSSRYVFYRAIITFPENLVLPFHVLIFRDVIRAIREKKTPWTLPIFFAASMLIHYRSIIIPVILVGILILYRIYSFVRDRKLAVKFFKSKALVRAILLILICIILSLPVLGLTIKQYKVYWKGNIGKEATYAPHTEEDPRYIPPSQGTYLSNIGIILCICLIFSLFLLFYKTNIEKSILIVWLGSSFILTRGTQFNIYVPSDRMLIYFIIPSVIASAYLLKIFIEKYQRNKMVLACAFSIALIFIFATTAPQVHGWQGISSAEFRVCSWINQNISSKDSVILIQGVRYINAGLKDYSLVETRSKNIKQVFVNNQILQDKILELYPDKFVYLIITKERESKFGELDYDIVYNQNGIKIYKIL